MKQNEARTKPRGEGQRTCFVISPIGPEESQIREDANAFLEYLVEPALQKYGFVVTRADRIAHATHITTDVVRHVQESDLCLIDLTGHNANVFYECGRRHETGKPFLQLVKKGSEGDLPFDVSGIRTIPYDLSSVPAQLDSVKRLQAFIDQIVEAGFDSTTSGDSLGSIAQGIERIERKVNQLILAKPAVGGTVGPGPSATGEDAIDMLMLPPREAFLRLIRGGNVAQAEGMLDRLEASVPYGEYLSAVMLTASAGGKASMARLEVEREAVLTRARGSEGQVSEDDIVGIKAVTEGLKRSYENTGQGADGLESLKSLYAEVRSIDGFPEETKGFVANKVGMLAWSTDAHDTCMEYTRIAIRWCPGEPAYHYNLALVQREEGLEQELQETLSTLVTMPDLEDNHKRLLLQYGFEPPGALN